MSSRARNSILPRQIASEFGRRWRSQIALPGFAGVAANPSSEKSGNREWRRLTGPSGLRFCGQPDSAGVRLQSCLRDRAIQPRVQHGYLGADVDRTEEIRHIARSHSDAPVTDRASNELFDRRALKMTYFLVTDFDELDRQAELKERLLGFYPVAFEGDGYLLFDLQNPIRQDAGSS